MAMRLAIGYLVPPRGNPRRGVAPVRSVHVTEHDSITSRPLIPQAVVTWSDADVANDALPLPVGAGDPATGIDGPRSFRAIAPARRDLDGRLLGVLGVLLITLAVAVAWQVDRPATTWVARDEPRVPIALIGRVPVVETRLLRYEPVATPVSTIAATETTTAER